MSDPNYVAIVAAGGPVLVAVTALVLNWWGFGLINKRLDDLRGDMAGQFAEVNRRLTLIDADLKEFFRDITRLKEKVGL